MALLIVKKKPVEAAPPPSGPLLSDFSDLIDLVGELQEKAEPVAKQIKALQDQLKPLKEAEKELQAKLDALEIDDDETDEVEYGAAFKVEVGKKGSSRKVVDMDKVRELMGDELFFKVAAVALKDIDAYLTQPQRDQVIETSRTSRSYKIIKRQ